MSWRDVLREQAKSEELLQRKLARLRTMMVSGIEEIDAILGDPDETPEPPKPGRKGTLSKGQIETLRTMWMDGSTAKEIEVVLGCKRSTIYNVARRLNLPKRNSIPKRSKKRKR